VLFKPIFKPVQANHGYIVEGSGRLGGANAVKEDLVLLEGRTCEIARAKAHSNLEKARKEGAVRACLLFLQRHIHCFCTNK
jgi:hypothetical protein